MNINEEKYSRYHLCREMLETVELIKNFDQKIVSSFVEELNDYSSLLLTGEGSSRIFPAKRALAMNHKNGSPFNLFTEGATQALEYNLSKSAVFGLSNSGKTKELIRLFKKLETQGHPLRFGISAAGTCPLYDCSVKSHQLICGKEKAVAATKSVVEQALFYDSLFSSLNGESIRGLEKAGDELHKVLTLIIDPKLIDKISKAETIYFAGRNNGVAEELTLKTNEISRKKSDFLEGTYGAHGIEEVMNEKDVLIVIDPFEEEEEKFRQCLINGVGMDIVAISSRKCSFDTIQIPHGGFYKDYMELAAGWNLLVEVGMHLSINLDEPVRARKVGNEVE